MVTVLRSWKIPPHALQQCALNWTASNTHSSRSGTTDNAVVASMSRFSCGDGSEGAKFFSLSSRGLSFGIIIIIRIPLLYFYRAVRVICSNMSEPNREQRGENTRCCIWHEDNQDGKSFWHLNGYAVYDPRQNRTRRWCSCTLHERCQLLLLKWQRGLLEKCPPWLPPLLRCALGQRRQMRWN